MATMSDDPYLWLENIGGEDALAWVRERNDVTVDAYAGDDFDRMRAEALEVLDTDTRIPYVRRRGEYLYNFWRDAAKLPHRQSRLGRHRRRRRSGPRRRRELGVGRRRRHRAGPHTGAGIAVPGWFRRQRRA
jgi:hypothetical protein